MKLLYIIFFLQNLFGYTGENDATRPALNTFQQEGQLVNITLVIGEPLKIYVVGRQQAEVDLESLKITVQSRNEMSTEVLPTQKSGDYFTVNKALGKFSNLEVITKVKGTSETFKFNLKIIP